MSVYGALQPEVHLYHPVSPTLPILQFSPAATIPKLLYPTTTARWPTPELYTCTKAPVLHPPALQRMRSVRREANNNSAKAKQHLRTAHMLPQVATATALPCSSTETHQNTNVSTTSKSLSSGSPHRSYLWKLRRPHQHPPQAPAQQLPPSLHGMAASSVPPLAAPSNPRHL